MAKPWNVTGAQNGKWKGGRADSMTYAGIRAPGHPRAHANGYVFEHILIAEQALGRPLPKKHPVHHFDENRANNSRGNLVICEDKAYHRLLHTRQRAFDACGDPSAVKCRYCKRYDRRDEMIRAIDHGRGAHRDCLRTARAARRRVA